MPRRVLFPAVMKVGLMSDTHNDAATVLWAVSIFNRESVGLVMHAGDISLPQLAPSFQGLDAPLAAVCGNNDSDWPGLRDAFAPKGRIYGNYYEGVIGSRRVVMVHELWRMNHIPSHEKFDVVVYGHTHHFDVRPGRNLMLNPGQCNRNDGGQATVAVLDLDTMEVSRFNLDHGAGMAEKEAR